MACLVVSPTIVIKLNTYLSSLVPADNETREKWFRAIPRRREDYEMNTRLRVCWIIHLITILYNKLIFFISRSAYTISMKKTSKGPINSLMD